MKLKPYVLAAGRLLSALFGIFMVSGVVWTSSFSLLSSHRTIRNVNRTLKYREF